MRWPWQKPKPRPTIPPYTVPVSKRETPKEPGVIVEEHEASDEDLEALRLAQSQTGLQRVWDRVTKQFK